VFYKLISTHLALKGLTQYGEHANLSCFDFETK